MAHLPYPFEESLEWAQIGLSKAISDENLKYPNKLKQFWTYISREIFLFKLFLSKQEAYLDQ